MDLLCKSILSIKEWNYGLMEELILNIGIEKFKSEYFDIMLRNIPDSKRDLLEKCMSDIYNTCDPIDKDGRSMLSRTLYNRISNQEDLDKYSGQILYMIRNCRNINLIDNESGSAIRYAINANISYGVRSEHIIVELLKYGANPSLRDGRRNISAYTDMISISEPDIDLIKLCIDHSQFDVDIEDVIQAVYKGHYDIIELLLTRVKDINQISQRGHNLMWYIVNEKLTTDEHIIELLVESGAVVGPAAPHPA